MDYNELFKQDAFKSINPEILDNFKELVSNIDGKDSNEVILYIMNFYNSIPKDATLSKEESDTLIKTIVLSLPKDKREKILNMIDLISNII